MWVIAPSYLTNVCLHHFSRVGFCLLFFFPLGLALWISASFCRVIQGLPLLGCYSPASCSQTLSSSSLIFSFPITFYDRMRGSYICFLICYMCKNGLFFHTWCLNMNEPMSGKGSSLCKGPETRKPGTFGKLYKSHRLAPTRWTIRNWTITLFL